MPSLGRALGLLLAAEVAAAGALAAKPAGLALTVGGDIGGMYSDPNHYKAGTFAGTRMISGSIGDQPSEVITLVGSDDGATFWTLSGKFTSGARRDLVIDFSPKGGPAGLRGTYADGRITFEDGNTWSKLGEPSPRAGGAATAAEGDIGGFYTDPNHFKQGTFAGTRMVSDMAGDTPTDKITLVGSDDGASFWALFGKFTDKGEGALFIDFSPKGGPQLTGSYADGRITYADGNFWSRQTHPV